MALNDPLATMLSKIQNAITVGKDELIIKPINKEIQTILQILKEKNYIQDYEKVSDGRGDHIILRNFQMINKTGVIKPRYSFGYEQAVDWEVKYLPAQGFGVIIVTTSQGIMTLDQAKEKSIGGKLMMYCY
ncbi:MAG: 30S ribosomal protein S8 [Candidatus Woesearchaeota archaeon]